MEKFNALPLSHKALLAFVIMATVAGLFHFVLIGDIDGQMAAAQAEVKQTEKKLSELKQYENPELMQTLEEEITELKEQLAANKALLPEAEEIPTLITAIKRQADDLGLKIIRFQKGERFKDDYVTIVPVPMEVEGPFPVVVSFFEALAHPSMRMMTVSDLKLKALPLPSPGEVAATFATVGGVEPSAGGGDKAATQLSPVEALLKRLDDYETSLRHMQISARFNVNAYTYSGELLTAEEREKKKRKRSRRR